MGLLNMKIVAASMRFVLNGRTLFLFSELHSIIFKHNVSKPLQGTIFTFS